MSYRSYNYHNLKKKIIGKPWKKLYFFDINAMYPATFREAMPCGRGFEWFTEDGVLRKKLMCNKQISLSSVQWIGSMENDIRFVDSSGKRCKILYGWNADEVKIGDYFLDGYCKVDDIEYGLEFDGCYYHGCDKCGMIGVGDKERQKKRTGFLKNRGINIIRMRECEWTAIDKDDLPESSVSSLLYTESACWKCLLNEILTDGVYGFAVVDIVPTSNAKKFVDLNWLPIIRHDDIHFDDLPPFMKKESVKKSFPRTTLVQAMHATEILLHTRLIQW